MSLRARAALVSCLAAGCAGPGVPEIQPHQLHCQGSVSLDTFVGQEGAAFVTCEVIAGTAAAPLAIVELATQGPFTATLIGADPSGGPVIQLRYLPADEGHHAGRLSVRYDSGGSLYVTEVEVAGRSRELPVEWDPAPDFVICRADLETSLLDQALASVGLQRDSFTFDVDLATRPNLDDPFRLSWLDAVRRQPARAGCFEGEAAGGLDHAMEQRHPVASAILHAATLLDRAPESIGAPIRRGTWSEALETLCKATRCAETAGELPDELASALAPVLLAIEEGIRARAAMDAELETRQPAWWHLQGGNYNMLPAPIPDALAPEDRAYLLGRGGRRDLYLAAARIAFAVEHVDWSLFHGLRDVHFDLRTDAGWIRVRDAADHVHADDGEALLLLLDLGGDDVYLGPVAANRSADNPVSVAIDLGGNDRYGYEVVADPADEGLLPSDGAGRDERGISRSHVSRQGAARNGIALLFDLGDGDDEYRSLRASQGYAHLGVGVLFDAGGNDRYEAESLSQGAAQFGIGLLLDAGAGNDVRRAFSRSQGFGFVGGAGLLWDGGGDDHYLCDNGNPLFGGTPLYPSPQLPGEGNSSFCQGAGLGFRHPTRQTWLSGGIGVLRDRSGDDVYEASVFAQGAGYWQGLGLLSDGGGADTYDGFWYVQGAAAHMAVGILTDAGPGDDVYGGRLPTRNMSLGSGHDFSTGVLIDEQGNDTYHLGPLAAGASNCNGLGLFVDNGGDDRYLARSDYGSGMGNVSDECADGRGHLASIGVMIDAGGADVYEYPASEFPVPSEGGAWGHARAGLPGERGAGLDAEGETGVHAESAAR